jgi:hypothetical protein
MALAKKKAEAGPAATELIAYLRDLPMTAAELKELVEMAMTKAIADLDRRAAEMKASRDGSALPLQVLERQLFRPAMVVCPCRIVSMIS